MGINNELITYGFVLSQEAFDMILRADTADIHDLYKDIAAYLKDIMGTTKEYKPVYPDFVKRFNPLDQATLDITFQGYENARKTYKVIKPCTDDEYKNIFTQLLSVGNSITKADQEVIKWFVNNEPDLIFPDVIPFKENLAIIATLCPTFVVRTVVDVLRVAVGMSGGDVMLPAVPKMLKKKGKLYNDRKKEREKFKFNLTDENKERILQLFESSNLDTRDMNQGSRYGRFIRLAEIICPQKYKTKYPNTYNAFNHLRNQKRKGKPNGMDKIRTFYSNVEAGFKKNFTSGLHILATRPGEFMRKLDYLIRTHGSSHLEDILNTFAKIGEKSSNKVLFEVFTHFGGRNVAVRNRSVFIKGARKRTPLPDLKPLSQDIINSVQECIFQCLLNKFRALPPLGKCWIDPELQKIPLPTNMRSISESLVPVIRGQRMPVPKFPIIRCYVHWVDTTGNTDLDLSGTFVGNKIIGTISYSNKSSACAQHSGDSRNTVGNLAEYLDINIEAALKDGYKYVMFDVRDYHGTGLLKHKATFGFSAPTAHRNLELRPDDISNSGKLTSPSIGTLICIFDLEAMEYIWIDEDSSQITVHNTTEVLKTVKKYTEKPKVSVYNLLKLHVEARGENSSAELADVHYKFEDFSTSYVKTLELMGV